jgi:3-hydroxyacyl-[acyl-carrier-protein] dehydratase
VTRKEKQSEPRHPSPVTGHYLGLPHRPPFIFVKKLIVCEPGVSAECETQFAADDPMFAGHFPDNPMVPGVILTEALAQTAGIAAAHAHPENSRTRFLLSAIRQMKFFRAVRPEEKIILRARKVAAAGELLQFEVEALIDNELAAAGQLVLNALPVSH